MITAERYHDISMGHRVVGHQHKCKHLHGHNYRIHFCCISDETDELGMVIDFGTIKSTLCAYLEREWDHKFMIWQEDPLLEQLQAIVPQDIVIVPFNPTAENMARYLVEDIAPSLLQGSRVTLHSCRVEETAKCSATYSL
ncbi:queuosine biosynthesis protein QueD [Porphyromonas crevioricanis]|uniref:6-carboxy-5,6,7,8-tetrahydropterin synthase n=1 Tax=Porphyromonas crevioricanis TaxID=393921 RepID=A0A2X4SRJ4_9PORP|nr:6-carboxytetrahydropterin synthase [Porphyromonas crevioricanis]GAD07417.1 queuosine biosynthesis QueD, PTPS-I [Porphyromonas crevioricanis JCM 13913]SQH72501.1 queuosine biosynthesis protein QueD [Porphyromonas crevioricanis]